MKYLVVLLLGAVCIQENSALFGKSCFGKPWARNSLKAKYSPLIFNGFYDLPKTNVSDDVENYVQVAADRAALTVPGVVLCRGEDARFCVIYDNNGTAIGTRTSALLNDVSAIEGFDYSAVNSYKETEMFDGQKAYSFDVFHYDPATITEEGVGAKSQTAEGLWATVYGKQVHLPIKDPKIDNFNGFQRQACFPQMGQHYFYNMNKTQTDCTQNVPFFGIYHNGELVGSGLAMYGKSSQLSSSSRFWYEDVPLLGAKLIMPNRAKCVDELITKNGLYSVHVYFVSTPALIGCLFQ